METLVVTPFTDEGRFNCELFPIILSVDQYIYNPSVTECPSDCYSLLNNKGNIRYGPARSIFYRKNSTLVRPFVSSSSMLKSSNQLSDLSDEAIKLQNESNDYVPKYEELKVGQSHLCETSREFRNQLGSEDSSYDSDCDVDNVCSQLNCVAEHEDVSRQVSDTLGAEFSEYVTLGCSELSDKLSINVDKLSTEKSKEELIEDNLTDHPNYASKVEFGLKLGYPESLVHTALLKLGGEAGQNELLEELIKLGASIKVTDSSEKKDPTILGEGGPNFRKFEDGVELRHIVIDGSNVAMSHGNKEVFSCKGIKICVDWFKARGHTDITVFVPKWRKETTKPDSPITDQDILLELEKERLLVFTPSRLVGGRRLVCYDDRYILKLASETDGVVVSNDNYRDLAQENSDFKKVVEDRILMYSFVNDRFMPPDDPLGRNGPTLDNFLCKKIKPSEMLPLSCPYAKKCTYGNKCKYYHPERGNQPQKSITDKLHENAQKQIFEAKCRNKGEIFRCKSLGICNDSELKKYKKMPLSRTKSSIPCVNLLPEGIGSKPFHKPSKSNSIENISKDKLSLASSKSVGNQTTQPRIRLPHVQTYHGDPSQLGANSEHLSQDINTHAKLQRQLTLNPCYDPRINQIRVQYANQFPRANSSQRSHLSVSGCASSDYQVYNMRHWPDPSGGVHSSLTRISSAPDSCQANMHHSQHYHSRTMHRLSSTSDSQLNLFNGVMENLADPFDSDYLGPDPGITSHSSWENVPFSLTSHCKQDDSRSKLYYHLSSLFPEEQVKIAMKMYPDELNPQKICAVILGMFPK